MYVRTIAGYTVQFPYEPYPIQIAYMSQLLQCLKSKKNGLLESPTGTGKTLSILCAAMEWLSVEQEKFLDEKSQEDVDSPIHQMELPEDRTRIIYASRTHVQLKQAMKELKASNYDTKASIILGSRDQLCINPEVSKLEGNAAKTHACRSKIRTGGCCYYDGYEAKVNAEYETMEVVDIEDLVTKGVAKKFCPYFASRTLKRKADVIFSPYNYLLDPHLRRNQGIDLKNTVIIFDEGHNIESNCEESASCELRSLSLEVCLKELKTQLDKNNNPTTEFIKKGEAFTSDDLNKPILERNADEDHMELLSTDLIGVQDVLTKLEKAIVKQLETSKDAELHQVPTNWIFTLMRQDLKLNPDKIETILRVLDKMALSIGSSASQHANRIKIASIESMATFFRTIFPQEGSMADFDEYKREFCQKFAIALEEETTSNNRYRQEARDDLTIVTQDASFKGWKLNLYCLSPSVAMKQLMTLGVKCVVITSGTLSPLDSFQSEMEIPFEVKLENRHVISSKQLLVCAVGSRQNVQLDSRYINRDNMDYYKALAETLIESARNIPDGLLVFFASYFIMEKTIELWKRSGQYSRLESLKLCFKEPQDKLTFNECYEKFKDQIDNSFTKGAIFFGVCRGKLSEGLDINNRYCRAVIMIGVPFPSAFDTRSVLKKAYLAKKNDPKFTPKMHYEIQMKRSLNQAIGRVIRHKDDYGAIILLDFRYDLHQKSLSKWIQPYFTTATFDVCKENLKTFFKVNTGQVCSVRAEVSAIRPSPIHIKSQPDTQYKSPFASASVINALTNSKASNKPVAYYPMFDPKTITNGKRDLPNDFNQGPTAKRTTGVTNANGSKVADKQSKSAQAVVANMQDFMKEHGAELKNILKEGNKLLDLVTALKKYKATKQTDKLAAEIIIIFQGIDTTKRDKCIQGISVLLKGDARKQFLTLCGLKS